MTPLQRDTLKYIKQGLLEMLLTVFIAILIALIVIGIAVRNDTTPLTAEPDCFECGCVTETETFNLMSNVL
jgi:hypothetical protein